jgi:glycosyltransferase involved in cell wall biosynthesis
VKVAHEEEERHWNDEVLPVMPADATVLGEITLAEKTDLLSRAKAICFRSTDEPFGWDDGSHGGGTPVIATPRSVPRVVVDGETGFVVPVEDYPRRPPPRFAGSARSARMPAARACRTLSKESMVAGYEDVFRRVTQ